MKVLDTFAGAGGFSLGFDLTGHYEIIGAIEYDQWAADTFKFNHPDSTVLVGDIRQFDKAFLLDTFEKPDIILGGPPCQGFSIANRKGGDPSDPRNSLFRDFVRLGEIFEPKIMIMENVPNIVKALTQDKKPVMGIIIKELENLGYYVYHAILSATDYGVPQIRKRLVIIASKEALDKPFPEPTHTTVPISYSLFGNNLKPTPTLWDAISDLPQIEARQGDEIMDYINPPNTQLQKMLRGKSDKIYNHIAMKHSKRLVERFASMVSGNSISDVPEHLKPFKRNGNGEFSEKLYDQNNRRMYADRPCHTIAASFYANFVHPFLNRNFTPREGARIQTFPDWYVFKGKPTVVSHKLLQREGRNEEKHLCQYNQIGNAVPPFLAKAIAENLITQLTKSEVEKKDHDFVIGVNIVTKMNCEGSTDIEEHNWQIPAVVIECKTYLDKTMLEGSSTAAEQLKQRNPNAIYIVVAEWLKLTEQVNLKKFKVNQIYVLRKQKNTDREYRYAVTYKKNPVFADVVQHLFDTVRQHLTSDWEGGISYGLQKGYLL